MYNHQPKKYICPLCPFAKGEETEYNKRSDIIFEDDKIMAYISPKWWINNPGHVIIIPKQHIENIYDVPDDLIAHIYVLAKKITIALKETYKCDGTSVRQHNEPHGNQDVFHFHVHVFPRYNNDELYKRHDEKRFVSAEERKPYADKLKNYFQSIEQFQ